jgi:carbon monoxide dehydrogenase subunit G
MQQSGEHRIAAPIDEVWRALNDPEVLARCIDGCEQMERVGEDAFQARVRAKVGPVSAVFTGEVTLADLDPPHAYTLQGSVKGGPAGFGKGAAKVRLTEDGPGATVLRYDVEGSVGGKLAQVGQRLIDGAARKMADDFFAAFSAAVAPPAPEPDHAHAGHAAAPAGRGDIRWLAGLVVVAILAAGVALLGR